MKITALLPRCLGGLLLASAFAFAARGADDKLVPDDTCVLMLQLPEGATTSVDGQDYGTARRLSFGSLQRGQVYTSQMAIAFRGGGSEQKSLLLRGGWRVPVAVAAPGEQRPEIVTQTGHSVGVTALAVSPDGRYAATGSEDKTVILWEIATGRQLRRFTGHTSKIIHVVFSPSGEEIMTTSEGMEIMPNEMSGDSAMLWDVVSGRRLRTFGPNQAGSYHVAFTSDGSQVFTISGKGVDLWDKATGNHLRTFPHDLGYVISAALSPDGRQFVAVPWQGGGKKAVLWNLSTGAQVHVFDGHGQDPQYASIHAVAFSPDGRRILTSTRATAVVWDADTGEKLYTFAGGHSNGAWAAFSPDSKWIVTAECNGTSGKAALWDANDGRLVRTFQDGFGWDAVVTFLPDGRKLLTDGPGLWDVETGRKLSSFGGGSAWPRDVQFAPDGRHLLICTNDNRAVLWNPAEGRVQQTLVGERPIRIERAVFSADGQRLLTSLEFPTSGPAVVWDLASGRVIQMIDKKVAGDDPCHAAISPDGHQLLLALRNGQVGLYDVSTARKIRDLAGKFQFLKGLAFSPDGRSVVTTSDHRRAVTWDLATGQAIRTFGEEVLSGIGSAQFSPDGRRLLVQGTSARIFDTATGLETQRFFWQENETIMRVAFSPDANQVLVAYSAGTVVLYDANSGAVLRTFRGHSDLLEAIAFSPDGRRILTGSRDNTVRMWSVATGEEMFSMTLVNRGKDWLLATREGLFDGSEGARQKVSFRVGGGLNIVPVDRFFQDFYRPGLMAAIWNDRPALPEVQIGKSLPPRLKIVAPATGEVETQTVTLQVEAIDQGGGIAGVTLYQNGARVLAPGSKHQEGKVLKRSFQIALVEGDNRLRVASASADGSWESEPAEIMLRYAKPLAKGRIYVVAVGINQYADANLNLAFAAKDAQALADLFQRRGKALYEQVNATVLIDGQATKAGIKEAFKKVAGLPRPQDTLLVFLAGHGTMLGQRYYFVPHDLRKQAERLDDDIRQQGLPADELSDYLGASPALKRILILDTCASGGALGVVLKGRSGFDLRGAIERLSRAQGIFTIAASSASEQAQESKELGHGVLSYALLAGLKGVDAGPLAGKHVQPGGPERVVDVMDWFSYASGQVPRLTEKLYGVAQDVQTTTQGTSFPVLPLEDN